MVKYKDLIHKLDYTHKDMKDAFVYTRISTMEV